ncbi:SAG-related sequence [Besnoitia besnoiti]|uniref:SAG-related sequence n=1 Tax=Besnoitia besnoiti TaxID=94643 RepID=A0A2A9MGF5_BESBE|nr:SAG-related sequence [Besnoitia besnoiti]PFH35341.1 SAG-related sequence [Besnoitia besnoiti]
MAVTNLSGVRRVLLPVLVVWFMFCMTRVVEAEEENVLPNEQVCSENGQPEGVKVTVDATTRTAQFGCGSGLGHLWPVSKKPEALTEYFTDQTCKTPKELTATFGAETTLKKTTKGQSLSSKVEIASQTPTAYTLTFGSLPDKQEKIYFKCANTPYSVDDSRSSQEKGSCLVTIVIPPKPAPPQDTCTPERQALSLTITKPGENATFKCGEKNSTLLPSEPRVFSEDCQTDQALDAAIPSAKMESQDGAHTLTVPKLPTAGTVICYKCVDQADKAAEQCSVKISVSGSESSGASMGTVSGFSATALVAVVFAGRVHFY